MSEVIICVHCESKNTHFNESCRDGYCYCLDCKRFSPLYGRHYCDNCESESEFFDSVCQSCLGGDISFLENDIREIERIMGNISMSGIREDLKKIIKETKIELLKSRLMTPEGKEIIKNLKREEK